MIYSGLYISGGCLGFLPPTVFSGDYADYVRFFDREVVEMLVARVASSPTCHLISASVKSMPRKEHMIYGGFPKMVGFPNIPFGFPTKNDHFGVEIGGTII